MSRAKRFRPHHLREAPPQGRLGESPIAEASPLPGAPAIINGLYDAVGVRCIDLPLKPEKLPGLLREGKEAIE